MKLIGQLYNKLTKSTKLWLVLDPKTWKIVSASKNPELALEKARKKGINKPLMVKGARVDGFRI